VNVALATLTYPFVFLGTQVWRPSQAEACAYKRQPV